uniref:WAP domain-containing protein n=1 Tax=Panthera leo TaxID=9689 RepID=A0A8C8WN08_PANLE
MKPSSLITFTVLLALEILTPWTAEGTKKVKSGACPFRPHGLCLVYEPHECLNDWQCPKDQKCCPSICSNKCMDPVDPSEAPLVNPGRCPLVIGECKEPNPLDTCLNDGDCLTGLKCCKGPCGNSCVEPLKGKIWHRPVFPSRRQVSTPWCSPM